jgi:hypothetical protein
MGTATQNRRYPRATIDSPGVMIVRLPGHPMPRKIPIAIRSISPEGLGVLLGETCPIEKKAMVTIDFTVGSQHFEIPGLVAWTAPSGKPRGALDLGVRFQLAMVPNAVRQAYATWVVDFLRRNPPVVPSS